MKTQTAIPSLVGLIAGTCFLLQPTHGGSADLILHNGKIVTVDEDFSIHPAMAVEGNTIIAVGSNDDIQEHATSQTRVIDLEGKTVLPGLIDSHVHPGAAMTEFDHPIPHMESIQDVLDYIAQRAQVLPDGEWIQLRQVFITRLKEQRYPTREELDRAAPGHPVVFATGPDASLNTLALELSGIDQDFTVDDGGPGYVERDPATGELTGLLRSCRRYIKYSPPDDGATEQDRLRRTRLLFYDYNASGLTTVSDRNAGAGAIKRYQQLRETGGLSVRMAACHSLSTSGDLEKITEQIKQIANHPLHKNGDEQLRVIGVKIFLDGGMLTGSAYMRRPWGISQIYGITDPEYQGLLFVPPERLLPIARAAVDAGLQFTAHSVGDGAVHTLLDVYETIAKETSLVPTRPCITHCNFMSREAVEQAARLGVVMDIQPAWLYLDARTLNNQFGYERLRYFQPLKSLFAAGANPGGGSDHMQKIGSLRAVNPYNPFLGMWITLTRQAKWMDRPLHPEETLSREQAIRFYTINNAYLLFLEEAIGSLEPAKRADFIILDRDILTCPLDEIQRIQVLETYLNGKQVYPLTPPEIHGQSDAP